MKILFLSNNAVTPDYLHDSVFHGLRSLYGNEVIDANKLWYLYKSTDLFNDASFESLRKPLHGWGYTYGGNLEDPPIDRTDLLLKIKNSYFDLIIAGICREDPLDLSRATYNRDELLNKALDIYPRNKLVFLDGSDCTGIKRPDLLNRGFYFKRENTGTGFPIWFAVPKEKFNFNYNKTTLFSQLNIPAHNRANYKHTTEQSYYKDYGESFFALTCKKGGWDCMRHYEIISQGTLPYFIDINDAPIQTMPLINRNFCTEIKNLIDIDFNIWSGMPLTINSEVKNWDKYHELRNILIKEAKDIYNTEFLAKYVIHTVQNESI